MKSETLVQAVLLTSVAAVRAFDLQRDVFDFKLLVEKFSGGFANGVWLGLFRDDQMSGE